MRGCVSAAHRFTGDCGERERRSTTELDQMLSPPPPDGDSVLDGGAAAGSWASVTDLQPYTDYSFWARGCNTQGCVESLPLGVTTPPAGRHTHASFSSCQLFPSGSATANRLPRSQLVPVVLLSCKETALCRPSQLPEISSSVLTVTPTVQKYFLLECSTDL